MTDFEGGSSASKGGVEQAYARTLATLATVAVVLYVVFSLTENAWIGWTALCSAWLTLGYMILCDPR